ncbi:MAG: RluA family pseudouridine synthase [Bacteroidota bacterium]
MSKKATRPAIIHSDEAIIIVNKPAGLLTIADRFDTSLPNLRRKLEDQHGPIFTVHRLDRDTSGVICFARDAENHQLLSAQFQDRLPEKSYLAIVEGIPVQSEGRIDLALAPDPRRLGKMHVYAKGKEAISHYEVVQTFGNYSLLKVRIETGRTHQIRVHLSAIGHPVVADPWYGRRSELLLSQIKGRKYRSGKDKVERPLLARTALHAARLRLQHPITEEWMTWEVEPPKDIRATLAQLGKWDR